MSKGNFNDAFKPYDMFASEASQKYILKRESRGHYSERDHKDATRPLREMGYNLRLYQHRLKGRHPLQLLASPDTPIQGDAQRGQALAEGNFILKNGSLSFSNVMFWQNIALVQPQEQKYIHGFSWLNDLSAIENRPLARQSVELIIRQWLEEFDVWQVLVWSPEVLSDRLLNWIIHAPLVMASPDMVFRSQVLGSMAKQARHLARTVKDAGFGVPSIRAATALTVAGLLLPGLQAYYMRGITRLESLITSLVQADGGVVSRNPSHSVDVMYYLILLKNSYREINIPAPSWIQVTLDNLAPFARGLRHGDGALARFNGAFDIKSTDIDMILAASDARGRACENASATGYQRLKKRRTTVIMDAGITPLPRGLDATAAGTLSFELSDGKDLMVVNMGFAEDTENTMDLPMLCRTSAAHSTVIVGDKNSTQIMSDGKIGRGVQTVEVMREDTSRHSAVSACHDGYMLNFGCLHRRKLTLSMDGRTLLGEDELDLTQPPTADFNAVARFHLHPNVNAVFSQGGGTILLRLPSGHGWQFSVKGGCAELTDSLFMETPSKPVKSQQILVLMKRKHKADVLKIKWSFERLDGANA